MTNRMYLSPPDVGPAERDALLNAFDSGWIAPAGPDLNGFELDLAAITGWPGSVAMSSGTAALHLALAHVGVGPGDDVFVSTFTFATFTPIHILFLPSGLLVAPWQEITIQWFYQGVIMFAGSTFGYPRAVAALGATPTSMAVALVPATVTLVAWIWLGEALSAIAIGGVTLVIAGMLAGGLKLRKSTAAPQE